MLRRVDADLDSGRFARQQRSCAGAWVAAQPDYLRQVADAQIEPAVGGDEGDAEIVGEREIDDAWS